MYVHYQVYLIVTIPDYQAFQAYLREDLPEMVHFLLDVVEIVRGVVLLRPDLGDERLAQVQRLPGRPLGHLTQLALQPLKVTEGHLGVTL